MDKEFERVLHLTAI